MFDGCNMFFFKCAKRDVLTCCCDTVKAHKGVEACCCPSQGSTKPVGEKAADPEVACEIGSRAQITAQKRGCYLISRLKEL